MPLIQTTFNNTHHHTWLSFKKTTTKSFFIMINISILNFNPIFMLYNERESFDICFYCFSDVFLLIWVSGSACVYLD